MAMFVSGSITSTGSFGSVHTAGNVGIGTTDPDELLQVEASTGEAKIKVESGDSRTQLILNGSKTGDGGVGLITFKNAEDDIGGIQVFRSGADDAGQMEFYTQKTGEAIGTANMVIDPTGNVGIGTTGPLLSNAFFGANAKYLTISDSDGAVLELGRGTDAESGIGGILFVNENNADASNLDADGKIVAGISVTSVTSDSNAGDDSGALLRFLTKPEAGTLVDRMRITADGNVGIGTVDPGATLHVQGGNSAGNFTTGVVKFENVGAGKDGCTLVVDSTISDTHADRGPFQVWKDGNHHINTTNNNLIYRYPSTTTTWDDSSDVRIKKNVVNLKGEGLSIVNQLRPVRFDYTDDFIEAENLESRHQHSYGGFIANEVREVLPDIVTSGSKEIGGEKWDDFLTMNETCFNSIMMASIQELSDKVDALEISNAELRAQVSGSS